MDSFTNLTWPGDPYRTGQQLYRRPPPRLVAFSARHNGGGLAHAAAIVYLPLDRTRTLTVTAQTLAFGFHAASTADPAQAPAVVTAADLDLMQARRHARVLAGHLLLSELAFLRQAAGGAVLRGVAATAAEWAARDPAPGRARLFDCAEDLPTSPGLDDACQQAGIITTPGESSSSDHSPGQRAAVQAVERALLIALVSARHLGYYEWAQALDVQQVMAAHAWDSLPGIPGPGARTSQAGRRFSYASGTSPVTRGAQ